jgi:hypothetical protein
MKVSGESYIDYLRFKASQGKPLPKSHGLWCKECKQSHPYNGTHKLLFDYEWRDKRLVILWKCPRTETVLGELKRAPTQHDVAD